jgi:hypothetical protein
MAMALPLLKSTVSIVKCGHFGFYYSFGYNTCQVFTSYVVPTPLSVGKGRKKKKVLTPVSATFMKLLSLVSVM